MYQQGLDTTIDGHWEMERYYQRCDIYMNEYRYDEMDGWTDGRMQPADHVSRP